MRAKRVIVERQVKNLSDVEWLKKYLDARFGYADYLRLNRKWKSIHIERIAKEIAEMSKAI